MIFFNISSFRGRLAVEELVVLKENRKLLRDFQCNSEYKMSEGSKQNAFDLIEAIVEEREGEVDNMEVLEEELELFYDCLEVLEEVYQHIYMYAVLNVNCPPLLVAL